MYGKTNIAKMNFTVSTIVIMIIFTQGISACKPSAFGFRIPNRDEINAFTKEMGINPITDKIRDNSSVVLYESDTSYGYYLLSVHQPEGTLSVEGSSVEKSSEPILILEKLLDINPFIAVIIQDETLLSETTAIEVTIDPYNTLGATTDGKAGVVLISPTKMNDWKTLTLYNAQGGVIYSIENHSMQQLRVMNSGKVGIDDLVILFPGQSADAEALRVSFGNIPAGEVSEYRSVPNGVYRYAAYEYIADGRSVEQPVMDWVGESSLHGEKFTYQLELDSSKEPGNQIRLVNVVVDQP